MTKFLIGIFIKNQDDVNNPEIRKKYGVLGGIVGIFCNIILCCAKFIAGFLTSSISITADAFNNLSDAGSSLVTLIGFKLAGKPADLKHPFGHGRIEYISGLFISLAVILMGVELGKTSIDKIISPTEIEFNLLSLVIIIISIMIKLWMFVFNRYISKKINSEAMHATAIDSISDVAATTTVVVGIIINLIFDIQVDGIVGAFVAIFILYSGFKSVSETLNPLLGEMPDKSFMEKVKKMVMNHKEIVGIHDLIIHNYGPGRLMMSLHAEVPSTIDILTAHDVIDIAEGELKQQFSCDAIIHMDPIVVDDATTIKIQNKVIEIIENLSPDLSIHDFRMTRGPLHNNLIFDIVVPYNFKLTDEEIVNKVRTEIEQLDDKKTYYAVIHIDKAYY